MLIKGLVEVIYFHLGYLSTKINTIKCRKLFIHLKYGIYRTLSCTCHIGCYINHRFQVFPVSRLVNGMFLYTYQFP